MSGFSIKYPFFIIVACLVVTIVATVTLVRMPVDLFPQQRARWSLATQCIRRHVSVH